MVQTLYLWRHSIKIHEYQSKKLLSDYGIPVPRGQVAASPDEARDICLDLGGKAVIKAQVYSGGRGKAGGVRLVESAEDARSYSAALLGTRLITAQTGPEGVPVQTVLVEAPASVTRELYIALTIDRAFHGPALIASPAGGVDIEEVAASDPAKIFTEIIDIAIGLQPFQARRLSSALGLEGTLAQSAAKTMTAMYKLFTELDCSLVEINPLVITTDGALLAVDAKVTLEDDALFRHTDLVYLSDPNQEDPMELEASRAKVSYVKLDGTVGCLVNGAGLAMATMDLVKGVGANPANFLDVGGTADEERVAKAIGMMLSDPSVKGILVNIFGGILRNDVVARGIVKGFASSSTQVPLVVRMQGTNADEGMEVLSSSGLTVTFASSMSELVTAIKASLT